MSQITRSDEAEAFLDARQHIAPEVVSACEGWTAHEVTPPLRGRFRSQIGEPMLRRLQALLSGY